MHGKYKWSLVIDQLKILWIQSYTAVLGIGPQIYDKNSEVIKGKDRRFLLVDRYVMIAATIRRYHVTG